MTILNGKSVVSHTHCPRVMMGNGRRENPISIILMEISYIAVSSSNHGFQSMISMDSHPNMLNELFYCLYAPLATEITNSL